MVPVPFAHEAAIARTSKQRGTTMTRLYAQPYDISAHGFYFETAAEYNEKASKLRNSYGWPVEEFELQFIDGESIDAKLFEALGVHQGNFAR
jgi:hypothetical protein